MSVVCVCGVYFRFACLRCLNSQTESCSCAATRDPLRTCILLCGQYTSANEELAKIAFVVMLKLAEISLFALIFL